MVTTQTRAAAAAHIWVRLKALSSSFSPQRSQVEVLLLQQLWFQVNQGVLKKVGPPLLERELWSGLLKLLIPLGVLGRVHMGLHPSPPR